ncbi:uncharacterized protein LOC107268917 [Cephus cinctus]|uniref:Uncharacterized protein LOC107268917 n=1 Tax=Cephus cinctus TaxID=211228 RepID=A0AAJ7RK66_CEPCN|nr:uncharacterized protein LOC107268917 [Cephus cinctus]XP_024941998.1 uncharacterized protein LOC107268917 [Cephus cinctus]XP_024941999.1 uncharacterized protein LOC107268917 [Cephus cinctus]XP_024942000.1 uncharacterized protein LOC107268917 [Cephus cinctus]XP_024942001.1 uncharacterized protein LOC107268917 [Cephus cinctus]
MSMKRLAVLAALQTPQYSHNNNSLTGGSYAIQESNMSNSDGGAGRAGRYETDLHGNVNILLGGAMLSGVVMVVVLVCYCCHRNIRKHRPQEYSQYWRAEPDVHSLEVFTMESHAMYYDRSTTMNIDSESTLTAMPRPVTPGPPPAYESLVFKSQSLPSPSEKKECVGTPGNVLPVPIEPEVRYGGTKMNDSGRRDDEGLPSYEAALKLEANGYV